MLDIVEYIYRVYMRRDIYVHEQGVNFDCVKHCRMTQDDDHG